MIAMPTAAPRETLIQLVQYVGYPRAGGLLGPNEEAIRDAQKAAQK